MSSESQFRKCPSCGREIHISTKYCPHCGNKKKLRWFHWLGFSVLGLVVLAGLSGNQNKQAASQSSSKNTAITESNYKKSSESFASQHDIIKPAAQKKFEYTIQEFTLQFSGAKNELQQSASRKKRREALASLGQGLMVSGWRGTIKDMTTTSQGQAAVSIILTNDLEITTWDNSFSDFDSDTLIDPSHNLYNILMEMSKGQQVEFSGSFFPSDEDYFEETSLTIKGSMMKPEFLFRFSTITALK